MKTSTTRARRKPAQAPDHAQRATPKLLELGASRIDVLLARRRRGREAQNAIDRELARQRRELDFDRMKRGGLDRAR